MKRNNCKNRNDTAGLSIDIEWHVCPGDASVQLLQNEQEFMSETGHAPESFGQDHLREHVQRHHQLKKSEGSKQMSSSSEWPPTQQDSDLVLGVSVVQDRKRPGHFTKNDHLTSLQKVNGTTSFSE